MNTQTTPSAWLIESTARNTKHYLHKHEETGGYYWMPHKNGALEFGTKQGATEMIRFNYWAAKPVKK